MGSRTKTAMMSAHNDTSNKPNKHQKDFTHYTKLQHIKLPQRYKQVQAMKNQFNLKRKEKTPQKGIKQLQRNAKGHR